MEKPTEEKPDTFHCCYCDMDYDKADYEERSSPGGDPLCEGCQDDYTSRCESCEDHCWDDNMHRDEGCSYCSDCFSDIEREREEEERMSGPILDYCCKPTPEFQKVRGETATGASAPAFFGLELEVESGESSRDMEDMAESIKDDHVFCKYDSSLSNGFEIVTHPMSEAWIKKNRNKLKDMLKNLKTNGYKSYQTTTCGIHIHISKDSFTTNHLYRFMKFFYHNPGLILVMSQRKSDMLNQWAALGTYDDNQMMRMANKKFRSNNRYTAVNLTRHTAEVRIFRGTLHDVSFFKNLEFLASLHRFTRTHNAASVTPAKYFEWVKRYRGEYRNLDAFLSRKTVQIDQATGYVYDRSKLSGSGGSDEQDQRTEI